MAIPRTATAAATHGGTNAAVAVLLGAYLAIALYQGNLGALASQAKSDLLGTQTTASPATGALLPDGSVDLGTITTTADRQPFWRWAVALLILIWLANNSTTAEIFGPLLGIALVAMLINVATTRPEMLKNLNAGLASFYGRAANSGAK